MSAISRRSLFVRAWEKSRVLVYYLCAAIMGVLAYDAARYVSAEAANQRVRNLMATIQNRHSENLRLLTESAEDLDVIEPFTGALAATKADAMAMTLYMSPLLDPAAVNGPDRLEVRELFRRALEITPRDGYLWARYALFLDHFPDLDQSQETTHALFRAMKNAPRDYNTIRIVSELGIKRWPWLNCSQRQLLVHILVHAQSIDDLILARWNTDMRFKPLTQHLTLQFQHYDFDLVWAKKYVAHCRKS